jgi:hypothetical protein
MSLQYNFTVEGDGLKLINAHRWCMEKFGAQFYRTNWTHNTHDFSFSKEEDAVLFALRWM